MELLTPTALLVLLVSTMVENQTAQGTRAKETNKRSVSRLLCSCFPRRPALYHELPTCPNLSFGINQQELFVCLSVRKSLKSSCMIDVLGFSTSQRVPTWPIRQQVMFLSLVLSGDVQCHSTGIFSRQGCYRSFNVKHQSNESLFKFRINQATWQQNLEQPTQQALTTHHSLGLEMGWPSLLPRMFAAALEAVPALPAAPCSSRHTLVQGLVTRNFITWLY